MSLSRIYSMAREVARNRNAKGTPVRHRAAVRALIRPNLKRALYKLRQAREALLHDDHSIANSLMMLARRYIDAAMIKTYDYLLTMQRQSKQVSANAPRKLTERQTKKIVNTYTQAAGQGSVYGVVKQLSAEHDVSTKTIRDIIKKYGQKNNFEK